MLLQFKVENLRSFKDEGVLLFEAQRTDDSHPDSFAAVKKGLCLKTPDIFGSNVRKEVRRYLISLGYAPKCFPPETATDPEQYRQYAEKARLSEEWQEGDVILKAEEVTDVEHVEAALATRTNAQEEVCETWR